MSTTSLALIPARAGSKRIPGKNIRKLGDHPLIAYTISAAKKAELFSRIVVSTDSHEIAEVAKRYGAEILMRPAEFAGDLSPDIDWVRHALSQLPPHDVFSLLRVTSPFRTADTIRRAWQRFTSLGVDSIRAVELCKQHPGKMWILEGDRMRPLLEGPTERPWHSTPYQALPKVYVQNASLEIAWCRVVHEQGTISGTVVAPFFTQELEGFDLNTPEDWILAERNVRDLPSVG